MNIIASLVTTFTIDLFGNVAVGIASGILTIVILLFGEITPKTGAMINSVRNSAIPTNTMLGGVCCVPSAERIKENEMIYRLKGVIITSSDGSRVMTVVRKSTSNVWTLSPFKLIKLSATPHSPPGLLPQRIEKRLTKGRFSLCFL